MSSGCPVAAVSDPAQGIFAFRGAGMDFIFPGMPSSNEKQVQHVLEGGREGGSSSGCCWSLAVMPHLPSLRTLFNNEPLSPVLGAAEPDSQPFQAQLPANFKAFVSPLLLNTQGFGSNL